MHEHIFINNIAFIIKVYQMYLKNYLQKCLTHEEDLKTVKSL